MTAPRRVALLAAYLVWVAAMLGCLAGGLSR